MLQWQIPYLLANVIVWELTHYSVLRSLYPIGICVMGVSYPGR
jgi:hypothetical protein